MLSTYRHGGRAGGAASRPRLSAQLVPDISPLRRRKMPAWIGIHAACRRSGRRVGITAAYAPSAGYARQRLRPGVPATRFNRYQSNNLFPKLSNRCLPSVLTISEVNKADITNDPSRCKRCRPGLWLPRYGPCTEQPGTRSCHIKLQVAVWKRTKSLQKAKFRWSAAACGKIKSRKNKWFDEKSGESLYSFNSLLQEYILQVEL